MSDTPPAVLCTRRLPLEVEERLSRNYRARLNLEDRLYDEDGMVASSEGCDAILAAGGDCLHARTIDRLPDSVRIIATYSVGYEHIAVDRAKARGIVVTHTPNVLDDATADVAMLCLLGAARRGAEGDKMVREDAWKGWHTGLLVGVHVTGKRLGIYGMGRIGRAVAQRARGFDMEIHYYNRRRLPSDLESGAIYHESPESMLRVSDFLSINAPSSPETRGFLNAQSISLLPEGAVVVNTARGDLIDDDALIDALRSGKVAAAGLDVFANEPAIDARYRELKNTFLLPHIGSASVETRNAMGWCCLDNLDAFFAGNPCPNAL
ncbi:2-hydroxyacid dehydrogenase [Thioalkalivibrio sp. HK1]|uniref:2-hydroxyacid dehydrogenase n=1 Tax=Thioalkalivibrio sp. HK1 TaxID=1469245 RepID=UPI000472EBF0|nr:D-glycerate dehydrogenase [Thioalkalivibrio sp. HK1]